MQRTINYQYELADIFFFGAVALSVISHGFLVGCDGTLKDDQTMCRPKLEGKNSPPTRAQSSTTAAAVIAMPCDGHCNAV